MRSTQEEIRGRVVRRAVRGDTSTLCFGPARTSRSSRMDQFAESPSVMEDVAVAVIVEVRKDLCAEIRPFV